MSKRAFIAAVLFVIICTNSTSARQASQTPAQPAVEEWGDYFDGDRLDDSKWELYTFEGGGSSKVEVKDKQLKLRGAGQSRSGVRTKQSFHADRFYVEAALAKVGGQLPQAGADLPGYAIVTVLFDGTAINRIEWIFRSDGLKRGPLLMGRTNGFIIANLTQKKRPRVLGWPAVAIKSSSC